MVTAPTPGRATAAGWQPVIGILALQGDVREHVRALTAVGARARGVRRPGELAGLDGLIVPGGESTAMGKLAAAFGMVEPLRALIRSGFPVYGSCAGMIMLADKILDGRPDQETLGGIDMTVRRNAFGRQVDSFEYDLAVEGLEGGPFHAVFIRAPWVESVGTGVEVLATAPAEAGAGGHVVAVRQGTLLATSFHPELTGDDRLHRLFADLVRAAGPAASASVAGERR